MASIAIEVVEEHLASDEGAALNVSVSQSSFLGKINTALTFLASFFVKKKRKKKVKWLKSNWL